MHTLPRTGWPTVGVLLAAGSGARSGLDYPKQFLRLGGLTVLEHTLLTFESDPLIHQILVVAAEEWLDSTQEIVMGSGAQKVCGVIPGGATRNGSTRNAIEELVQERGMVNCKVLMHDAVRPLVDRSIIRRCVEGLDDFDAVDVVIETADTIVEVDNGVLVGIPPRSRLRRGQTPQGFILPILKAAYDRFHDDELARFTDDCAVILNAFPDVPIAALEGSEENIKITRPVDIYLADRLLQARQTPLPKRDNDILQLPGTAVVVGGTSGIGKAVIASVIQQGGYAVALSRSEGSVDVRDEASVTRALKAVRDLHGPIAAVVNSAGVLTHGALVDASLEDIELEVRTNLMGALHVARAAYPFLRESRGHLLQYTSSSYTRGRAGYAVYSATKAGVVNITQALAEEWLGAHIKVNCVNPARTKTPMRKNAFGDEPEGSLLSAERVAEVSVNVLTGTTTGHVFDVRL